MSEPPARDFLDKARLAAAALMLAAAAAAIAGSLLDWVVIVEQPDVAPNTRFEAGEEIDQPNRRTPYSGIEARDGWIVIVAAGVLVLSSVLLATKKRSSFAWLGFLATIPIGAIAIADYRSIGDPQSSLARRMDVVGDVEPAVGITLVAVAALAGLIAAVLGIAASPSRTPVTD